MSISQNASTSNRKSVSFTVNLDLISGDGFELSDDMVHEFIKNFQSYLSIDDSLESPFAQDYGTTEEYVDNGYNLDRMDGYDGAFVISSTVEVN